MTGVWAGRIWVAVGFVSLVASVFLGLAVTGDMVTLP